MYTMHDNIFMFVFLSITHPVSMETDMVNINHEKLSEGMV